MAVAIALLDTLPVPSTNGVGTVYHQLKDILGVAAEQQAESSLQRWDKVSILSPSYSKANQQRTVMEHSTEGTTSSPTQALSHLQLGHLSRCPGPVAYHWAYRRGEWHVLGTTCAGCVTMGAVIGNDAAIALRGLDLKHIVIPRSEK
jgi:hypothetical protein